MGKTCGLALFETQTGDERDGNGQNTGNLSQ